MRVSPTPVGVVAFGGAFLAAFAGDDRAVKVHSHRSHADLLEKPALQRREHRRVARLGELAKEPAVGALTGQALVLKDGSQGLVLAQPVAMNVAAGPGPDAQPETLNDMHRIIGAVGPSPGQVQRGEMFPDAGLIDKALHQRHAAKGRHRLVGILNGQVHHRGDCATCVNPLGKQPFASPSPPLSHDPGSKIKNRLLDTLPSPTATGWLGSA